MIPPQLVNAFSAVVRDRGDGYVSSGAVQVGAVRRDTLHAVGYGSAAYELAVSATDGLVTLSCTCPYANDYGACKHLWALLCVADSRNLLASLLSHGGTKARYHFIRANEQVLFDKEPDEVVEVAPDPVPDAARIDSAVYRNSAPTKPGQLLPQRVSPPLWRQVLSTAALHMQSEPADGGVHSANHAEEWPADRRLVYIIDLDISARLSGLQLEVGTERMERDGIWGPPKPFGTSMEAWGNAPDFVDRQIREMLLGATAQRGITQLPSAGFTIHERAFDTTLRVVCETGRCRTRSKNDQLHGRTVSFDDGPAWNFSMRMVHDTDGAFAISGVVERESIERPMSAPQYVHAAGVIIIDDRIARINTNGAFAFIAALREASTVPLGDDPSEFLEQMYRLPRVPALALPPGVTITESHAPPVPAVNFTKGAAGWRQAPSKVLLRFRYGSTLVDATTTTPRVFDRASRTLYTRQPDAETAAKTRLKALGAREEWNYSSRNTTLLLTLSRLASAAAQLTAEGWHVEADGVAYRWPGQIRVSVRSGIDWFDLHGTVQFGDTEAPLSKVLDAWRRHEGIVDLDNGSIGFVPVDDLKRMGVLLSAGERVGGALRYRRTQLALLDVLLEALPSVDVDHALQQARTELATFERIEAADAPPGFHGTLREYQREGLAWFHFLRRFGLGGCLADDMGLGKTVQVLALLEERRAEKAGISLIVVPRSLVFNWIREAERFAPALRVLDFSSADRTTSALDADEIDVAITTYGTVRRDVAKLGNRQFDYVILDEAQAIKNAGTATAKACRLLNARHRLALSGTPIENRIEELWSLFEFLNPGMLGASTHFGATARASTSASATTSATAFARSAHDGSAGVNVLSKALRPVILRRKKSMVARELPARVEQTLDITLEPKQRAFYEQLRRRFQTSVRDQIEREGMHKSRMHILEALLRLRQVACHPVLADPTKHALPSAKLDALMPALQEIASEGNKALVFSQFTSFLALVRQRLDAEGISYEYLDGRTKDRQSKVDRFQNDEACPVFLISLKAGGHGLNLTSAEYVFLLDPWWNPAVEAQAIDRAHRIGQSRRVIATRLVARDTIESKILQLQESKRQLAEAILTEDKGALGSIGIEELELLLS